MTRTTRLIATILMLGVGTFLLSPCSISATSGPPRLHETGSRFEDTVSPDSFAPDLDRAFRQFQARRLPNAQVQAGSGPAQINLIFHVLSGEAMEGNVSESVLLAQVSVLNEAYRSTGLQFIVTEIRRYPDSVYFAGGCFPTTEQGLRMKAELAVNPARFVNIYTCKLALPYIAGYGTLPNEFTEDDHRHGVIIDYGTLPGNAPPLDMGHTLVHELGHYFGLFHTFQGGCAEPGDGVADTPAEASAAFGCQVGRDTCMEAGMDPINNFMDYSDDSCTNNFTTLQAARMQASIATFRPSLIATAFSTAVEYYHVGFDHYFMTAIADEITELDNGTFVGWSRTGVTFNVYPLGHAGSANVCRFFSTSFAPKSSHFYTPSASECAIVKANPNWQFEAEVFSVDLPTAAGTCASGTQALYRLYNNGQGAAPNHRYTTSAVTRSTMIGNGWIPEGEGPLGVIGCVPL